MKYMLLSYGKEQDISETEHAQCREESAQICHELQKQGKFIAASPIHSVASATSLRIRNGKRVITDGPFAETTEQLGGYYIIDVDDLDEALSVASRLPPALNGTVEIRPIFEMNNLPITQKLISKRRNKMTKAAQPIPPGFSTLTPHLVLKDCAKAIEFYKKAFGAEEMQRMLAPDGKIMHACLKIGNSMIFFCDEFPMFADIMGQPTNHRQNSCSHSYVC